MEGPYGPLLDTTVRVATWNIWWRFGPWESRAPAIVETLRGVDADIVCLQEVWGEGGETSAGRIADELGLHHTFSSRLDVEGVEFGNAILSRWPFTATEWWPLPAPVETDEHRTLLVADVDGPRGALQVWCTHLNWRFDHSGIRQEQVRFVAAKVADRRPRAFPPIVCGDLNAAPDSDEIRMLTGRADLGVPKLVFHDAWEVAGAGAGETWSNDNPYAVLDLEPARRIDYVLVGWPRAGGAGHVVCAELVGVEPVDGVVGSDHYGVVADLRY